MDLNTKCSISVNYQYTANCPITGNYRIKPERYSASLAGIYRKEQQNALKTGKYNRFKLPEIAG